MMADSSKLHGRVPGLYTTALVNSSPMCKDLCSSPRFCVQLPKALFQREWRLGPQARQKRSVHLVVKRVSVRTQIRGQRSVLVVWSVARKESDIGAWFVQFLGLALFLSQGYSG